MLSFKRKHKTIRTIATLKLSTAAVRCAWLASPCTATAFHPDRLRNCANRQAVSRRASAQVDRAGRIDR